MAVHPVGPPGLLKLRELQFAKTFRVINLLKHHSWNNTEKAHVRNAARLAGTDVRRRHRGGAAG